MNRNELHYKILALIEDRPESTQREISSALGISLGSTNYAIKSLIDKGFIKIDRFQKSRNKKGYLYMLTLSGLAKKASLAVKFIKIKRREHKLIQEEITRALKDIQEY